MIFLAEALCFTIALVVCILWVNGVTLLNSDMYSGLTTGIALLIGFSQFYRQNLQRTNSGQLIWRERFITAFERLRKETKDHFNELAEDPNHRLGASYILTAFELVERDLKPLEKYWSTFILASNIIKEAARNRTELRDNAKDVQKLVRLSNRLQSRIKWWLGDAPDLE